MAVTAIDTVVGNVMLMAEGNGLVARYVNRGCERADVQAVSCPHY